MQIIQEVESVITTLKSAGFEAYLVGGCVRDYLLGKTPTDWDVATSATPEEMKNVFTGFNVIETGIKHGTLTVMMDKFPVEITTFRIDGEYEDGRHPESVSFVRNLKLDMARRDFTINALACDTDGTIIDYFGGADDLEHKIIRSVGNPDERLNEDALRILRALRFSAVLGFEIEESLRDSLHRNLELLKKISCERIAAELMKMLVGQNIEEVLLEYHDIFAVFIPEIAQAVGFEQRNPHHIYDVWEHTVKALASSCNNPLVRLTLLFHDLGKPKAYVFGDDGVGHFYKHELYSMDIAEVRFKELKLDNNTTSIALDLIKYHGAKVPETKILKWLNRFGEEKLRLLFEVKKGDTYGKNPAIIENRIGIIDHLISDMDVLIEEQKCYRLKDLKINGHDIINNGVPEGAEIGKMLKAILNMVMEGQIENDRVTLLSEIKRLHR